MWIEVSNKWCIYKHNVIACEDLSPASITRNIKTLISAFLKSTFDYTVCPTGTKWFFSSSLNIIIFNDRAQQFSADKSSETNESFIGKTLHNI